MIVLKLGGSVVTEKDSPETVDGTALERAAAALADHDDLVLVHGGGSFGHPAAERHGVSSEDGTTDAGAVRAVHAAMGRLNAAVLDALGGAGVPAVPVRPLSTGRKDAGGDLHLDVGAVRALREEGFVPVLHGDVVAHAGSGASVASGDALVVALAAALDADRVGVCSTVPGVLDADGEVVPEVTDPATLDALGGSESTDVTGGMTAKVAALADLETPAHIFGLDDLAPFLDGERVGTVVR